MKLTKDDIKKYGTLREQSVLREQDEIEQSPIIEIESYIPVFPGFYNTYFDPSHKDMAGEVDNFVDNYLFKIPKVAEQIERIIGENSILDDSEKERQLNNFTDELISKIDIVGFVNDNVDNAQYEKDVCESVVDVIESQLKSNGLVTSIEMQDIVSPKEYNYNNDSINCKYSLSKDNINNINEILNDNSDKFASFINDRYTSVDGFISGHSNNVGDWDIQKVIHDDPTHKFGAILEFILEYVFNYNDESLYYDTNVYIDVNMDKVLEQVSDFIDTEF